MALRIPHVAGLFAFRQSLALDGRRWILRLRWDSRTRAWYLDLADEPTGSWVIAGARIVPAYPLGLSSRARGGPGGVFVALPKTDADVSLDAASLGDSWGLYYLTKSEVDAGLTLAQTASDLTIEPVAP